LVIEAATAADYENLVNVLAEHSEPKTNEEDLD